MRGNVSNSLNLLCFDTDRKVKCYNGYFINRYVFHTEEYDQGRKTYNSGVYFKESTSNMFEVNYFRKLEEVIECNIIMSRKNIFIQCYWYDTR
jgi:hypothetical protein